MDEPQDQLELNSQLTELSRVQPWVDGLADRYGLAEDTRFAINLCLEEALANVVLHGYKSEPGHPVVIRSWASDGALFFAIEDKAAPPFVPLDPGPRKDDNLESMQPGGNGIRLMYRFAGSVSYEELAEGNRVTISFPIPVRDVPV
jgi:anti-sigma regulatory factor (Ser/Thr protein kinase)